MIPQGSTLLDQWRDTDGRLRGLSYETPEGLYCALYTDRFGCQNVAEFETCNGVSLFFEMDYPALEGRTVKPTMVEGVV